MMFLNTKLIRTVALGCGLALGATSALAADEENTLVTLLEIDGFAVTNLHLALFASQTGRNPQQAEEQIRMLNELANNFMLANSPEGKALASDPEIAAALQVARARLLAQAFVRSELEKVTIDEAEVQKRYDATYGGEPKSEYKARHILLNSRDAAVAAIKSLDKGEDFAKLAEKHSIGPSKSVGGDLGWFEAGQMVPEFGAATAELSNGSYTKEPVKTQFGWHVILREDSREVPQPDLKTARAEIEGKIRQEYVAKAIRSIRDNAKIEVQEAGGEQ